VISNSLLPTHEIRRRLHFEIGNIVFVSCLPVGFKEYTISEGKMGESPYGVPWILIDILYYTWPKYNYRHGADDDTEKRSDFERLTLLSEGIRNPADRRRQRGPGGLFK
jgi:hypothetical protein